MVTGRSAMMRNSEAKSSRWNGSRVSSALARAAASSAMIMRRTAPMRSGAKNMCSVRQRPMPSAPKRAAVVASAGVSALARTLRRRTLSAQPIRVEKSPDSVGSMVATRPTNTSPVEPSSVIQSPAFSVWPPADRVCAL